MAAEARDETRDVVALWRLLSSYADVVTRRAWSELTDLFVADASIEVDTVTAAPRHFDRPAALGEFIGAALERFDHFEFVILNRVFDFDPTDPDVARGRVFMSEIRREKATGEWSTTYGLYQDSYRRSEGRWWFADRHYRSLARTGSNEGAFGLPDGLEPFDR
ncbi:MAG TPA: nuclear transport factor 2 family protein [Mycobacteriales bacterium]|nr:nuclear transport factor 2 family protein [Mycobacteriales bacterium]